MKPEVMQALAEKAAKLPMGRNELSPRPLASVFAEGMISPDGVIRVINFRDSTITEVRAVDSTALDEAKDFNELKTALIQTLLQSGIVRRKPLQA